ncbi:MAG: hypothetical protein MJH09_10480 [Cetobacterium sp.]|nr:hypothetical protein [Cetobacterium sp.]
MEMINFILSQCVSYLVGILSGLSTNYIDDKLKSHSMSVKTKSDFELNIDFKNLKFNVKNKKSKY